MNVKQLRNTALLIVAAVFAAFCLSAAGNIEKKSHPNDRKTVIIDAGHGGFDGGATASDGTAERISIFPSRLSSNSCSHFTATM